MSAEYELFSPQADDQRDSTLLLGLPGKGLCKNQILSLTIKSCLLCSVSPLDKDLILKEGVTQLLPPVLLCWGYDLEAWGMVHISSLTQQKS